MTGIRATFYLNGEPHAFRRINYVPRVGEQVVLYFEGEKKTFTVYQIIHDFLYEEEKGWAVNISIK